MPEPKAKGKGLGKKVGGIPVYVWALALVGGLIVGVYLRRGSAGSAAQPTTTPPADTSGLGDLSGIATTPSANGLGSATTDGTAAMDTSGLQASLDNIGSLLTVLTQNVQDQANGGSGGLNDNPPAWNLGATLANTVPLPPFTAPWENPGTPSGALTTPGGVFVSHNGSPAGWAQVRTKKASKKPVPRPTGVSR